MPARLHRAAYETADRRRFFNDRPGPPAAPPDRKQTRPKRQKKRITMKKILTVLAALAAFAGAAFAQIDPMAPIPADTALRTGRLANGMTYYIRHNEKPKGQADFYILHNVGAIQESDSQQGLAHFLEHMAFNGTEKLPGKQLTEYLEKVGVKFGANLNAATGWDRTTYLIKDVPTQREGIIDSALLILHEWSHFIALEPEEIDAERGVIMEELRTRDGANFRSMIEMIKALGKGSKYETRNLIGYLDDLKSFSHDQLEAFYRQWYRPDYQAVVVVGDVDVDAVERKIGRLMSDIPAPAADAPRKESYVVPDNEAPIVSIYTDREMQGSSVKYFFKRPAPPAEINATLYGQRLALMQTFMSAMTDSRLEELSMQPDAPFLSAGMSSGDILGIIPTMETTAVMLRTEDGKLAAGFEALCTELERIRRHGFTQSEFERVQNDLMRRAEQSYANRNDRRNGDYVDLYLNNYVKNTPMPDAESEWRLDSLLIRHLVTVEEVNAAARRLLTPRNEVIAVTAPEKEGCTVPSADELLAIRARAAQADVAPYEDEAVARPLIPGQTQLPGAAAIETRTDEAYGTTEWTLANGARIVVKPTAFKADEIRLAVTSEGGLSVLNDDEYYLGEMMPNVNALSGLGEFSATELKKQLSGKSVSVSTAADNYYSRMNASCSPRDLETMLQLLYLQFTAPRFDETDFRTLVKMLRAQLDNAGTNPDYLAEKRFYETAYGHRYRRQLISPEIVDSYRFEALPTIYRKLYPGAGGFTFVFVGNVDPATLLPLAEKYIGSIPAARPLTYTDDGAAPVSGEVTEEFAVPMQQPKVTVNYLFSGRMPYTLENKLALTFLSQALDSRYLVSIREEKGGTYGVGVRPGTSCIPQQSYELRISFDTNREMADELCEIVLHEIRRIAEHGPRPEDVEKTREYLLKSWKNGLEQNGNWMSYLLQREHSGLDYLADYERTLQAVGGDDVRRMARKLLDDGNLIKVVMRPCTEE